MLFTFVFVFSLQSCAHNATIESTPTGAKIYTLNEQGKRSGELGKTPSQFSSDAPAFELQATGYYPTVVLLPNSGGPLTGKYSIPLSQQSQTNTEKILFETQPEVLNKAVVELFSLQSLITDSKYKEADEKVRAMNERYAFVAIFHVLRGHMNVGRKNVKLAIESFEKALELDPKNEEARSMISFLRTQKTR